jgi:hypothetical protein
MEDMKWFDSAMLCVLAANNLRFCLSLAGICQTYGQQQCQEDHGMSKISHSEPSKHCNITHWTHMEEMKWFDSAKTKVVCSQHIKHGGDERSLICKQFKRD